MLNYTQTFDICDALRTLFNDRHNEFDESTAEVTLLGQEKGGGVMFSWLQDMPLTEQFAPPGSAKEKIQVTNIGMYDPYTKKIERLYIYESKVKLVNATVNEDRTFIGFVTRETMAATGTGRRLKKHDVYKAFLAEIQPQNRTFSLNLEKQSYIRLQFLHGTYQGAREAHLLVMLHKESIGLYHLTVARMGEGFIMSKEPRKEALFSHKFVWCQWDPVEDRLYVIYHKKESSSKAFLVGYQFSALSTKMATYMMEQALDLPIPRVSSTSTSYPKLAPSQVIQDSSINISLLVLNNGTLCLCCQHSVDKTSQKSNMEYSVTMLHHGQTMTCVVNNVPEPTGRLLFSWLGSHVCVQLAGSFVHLLNVDIEFEPGHHILWHDKQTDLVHTPAATTAGMVNLIRDKHSAGGVVVVEAGRGYRVSIDGDQLAACFRETEDVTMRLAILHYALVHNRDVAFMIQLCKSLCEDETSVELVIYLKEALVGIAYSRARRQVEDVPCRRCFPYTTAQALRGQACKDGHEVLSQLSYSPLKSPLHVGKSPVNGDLWQNLGARKPLGNAPSTPPPQPHFCTRQVLISAVRNANAGSMQQEPQSPGAGAEKPSLLKRLTSLNMKSGGGGEVSGEMGGTQSMVQPLRASSRTELGPLPHFLHYDHTPVPYEKQRIGVMSGHMSSYISSRTEHPPGKHKLQNVAAEYLQCQMYSSRLLCHILWGIIGEDGRNFHILERFLLACIEQGFPYPQPFVPFLTQLAFEKLPLRMFLSYVDQEILQVTPDFVKDVITRLDDSAQNVDIKKQLLLRLPQSEAVACVQQWSHPVAKRCAARLHAAAIYSAAQQGSPTTPPVVIGEQQHSIPALQALCTYLRYADINADCELIQEAAFLEHGKQESQPVSTA